MKVSVKLIGLFLLCLNLKCPTNVAAIDGLGGLFNGFFHLVVQKANLLFIILKINTERIVIGFNNHNHYMLILLFNPSLAFRTIPIKFKL